MLITILVIFLILSLLGGSAYPTYSYAGYGTGGVITLLIIFALLGVIRL